MKGDDEAVIATRRAYEAGVAAWANSGIDRYYASPRRARFADAVHAADAGDALLDLGCGPGFDSLELTRLGFSVGAFDVTLAMLKIAGEGGLTAGCIQGDARSLPFRNASFAGVWASASLLHLPKAQVGPALAEVGRVLTIGGVFYSGMKEGDQDQLDLAAAGGGIGSPRHFAHYRPGEWTGLLEAAGFVVREQDIDHDQRPGYPDWIVTLAVRF
jgi:SAM-dependent methyltransferase